MNTLELNRNEIKDLLQERMKRVPLKNNKRFIAEVTFLIGRLHQIDGKLDEAVKSFGKCNSILIENGLPENYELYYWMGRIEEHKMNISKSMDIYNMILSSEINKDNEINQHTQNRVLQILQNKFS